MRLLLPLLLLVAGIAGGVGAGFLLVPPGPRAEGSIAAAGEEAACAPPDAAAVRAAHAAEPAPQDREYVKLNNQFVVPVVARDRVNALVVLSLSLEIAHGKQETVYALEPKLRDEFLQVLFDHANAGGFDGSFTAAGTLGVLRGALLEAAQQVVPGIVSDVLLIDLARQEV